MAGQTTDGEGKLRLSNPKERMRRKEAKRQKQQSEFQDRQMRMLKHKNEHGNKSKKSWIRDLTVDGLESNPGPQTMDSPKLLVSVVTAICLSCLGLLWIIIKTHSGIGWLRDLTAEGVEPNPGPDDRKCNNCGKKGHVKKDCKKNNNAKGGGNRAAQGAMNASVADLLAMAKAVGDVEKEKEKDKKEEKKKEEVKCRFFEDGFVPLTFEVEVDESITPYSWVRLAILMKLAPFLLMFFFFDLGLWPHICILTGTIVGTITSNVWVLPVFIGLMALENFLVGYLVYYSKVFFNNLLGQITFRHRVTLNPVNDQREFGDDHRPIDCTFGPRHYVPAEGRYFVDEVAYLSFDYWSIHFCLGERMIAQRWASSTAIALFGSTITSHLSAKEYSNAIRRNLSKCSKIDWNAEHMIRNDTMESTCLFLEYLKMKIDQKDHIKSVDIQVTSDGPLLGKPRWLNTWVGKIYVAVCILGLIYFGLSAFFSIVGSIFRTICLFWAYVVAFFHKANEIPGMFAIMREGTGPLPHHTNTTPSSENLHFPGGFNQAWHGFGAGFGVYGVRITDKIFENVKINTPDPLKELEFTNFFPEIIKDRNIMGVFSGFAIPGIAMPMIDRNDAKTTAAGLVHRGAATTPKVDPVWNKRKKEIVDELIDRHFLPYNDSDLIGFNEMIDNTSYTLDRKRQIKDWHENRDEDFARPTRHKQTGMFNKEEPYMELKQARSIQGMYRTLTESDVWGSVGRLVHTVQRDVYDLPPSIKHLNPQGIIDKMMELGPGSKTVSDYSSYEASFKEPVKEAAQFRLYDRLTENLSGYAKRVRGQARWVLGRTVDVKNKFFNATIKHIKCSGDFDTALSNWFDNVATWLTVFDMRHGVHWTDSINWIRCEGDDNITDDRGFLFEADDFANLGMTAKISNNLTLSEAGFCQKYVNTSTGNLVGDVITFLGKRQYLPAKYANSKPAVKLSLSRATAMSVLSMFPNAPGISEWAHRVLELTNSVTVKAKHLVAEIDKKVHHGAQIATGQLEKLFGKPLIKFEDRLMVSHVFGFTLEQQQVLTETLEAWNGGPLVLPVSWFPEVWQDFYQAYNSYNVSAQTELIHDTLTLRKLREHFPESFK